MRVSLCVFFFESCCLFVVCLPVSLERAWGCRLFASAIDMNNVCFFICPTLIDSLYYGDKWSVLLLRTTYNLFVCLSVCREVQGTRMREAIPVIYTYIFLLLVSCENFLTPSHSKEGLNQLTLEIKEEIIRLPVDNSQPATLLPESANLLPKPATLLPESARYSSESTALLPVDNSQPATILPESATLLPESAIILTEDRSHPATIQPESATLNEDNSKPDSVQPESATILPEDISQSATVLFESATLLQRDNCQSAIVVVDTSQSASMLVDDRHLSNNLVDSNQLSNENSSINVEKSWKKPKLKIFVQIYFFLSLQYGIFKDWQNDWLM